MKLQLCTDSGELLGTEPMDGAHWTMNGGSFVCQEFISVAPIKESTATHFLITDNGGNALVPGRLINPVATKPGKLVEFKPGDLTIKMYAPSRRLA